MAYVIETHYSAGEFMVRKQKRATTMVSMFLGVGVVLRS